MALRLSGGGGGGGGGAESKAKCNPSDLGCGGCAGVKYDAQLLQFIW